MPDSVNVLLSTYNGMRFCEQQIKSLLSQSYPHIKITVRDDGSTDGTYERMLEYERHCSNFVVFPGNKNLGACKSYLKLLSEADPGCAYYAFCDQDDVWLQHKIRDAVQSMASADPAKPVMYFSRLEYVDAHLRHLGFSSVYDGFGFKNALVENIVTGCTIVLNRSAQKLISEQNPACILMHDYWCYLVVSALGDLIYDIRPNIKYRQHGANAIGHPTNCGQKIMLLLQRYFNPNKSGPRPSHQAEEFHRLYGTKLGPAESSVLDNFLAAKNKILSRPKYALHMEVWKQSSVATALLPLRILTGRF